MEITCQRCKTEYEFDDALISERGTTVRCTSCGEQFKVHRPAAATAQPERWVVKQHGGREIAFNSLKELQRAIAGRQIGRNDLLTRGNGPARPLGSIPELEPFFSARLALPAQRPGGAPAAGPNPATTLPGTGGAAPAASAQGTTTEGSTMFELGHGGVPVRTGRTDSPPPMIPGHGGNAGAAGIPPAAPLRLDRIPPVAVPVFQDDGAFAQTVGFTPSPSTHQPDHAAASHPQPLRPQPHHAAASHPQPSYAQPSYAQPSYAQPSRAQPYQDASAPPAYAEPPYPPPPPPQAWGPPSQHRSPPASSVAPSLASHTPRSLSARPPEENPEWFDEPRFTPVDGHRSRGMRWLVTLLLLGLAGFFAAAFSKKYMPALKATVASWSGSSASSAPETEARVSAFLQEGERALADGDLDAAKESFDKASAFAERDPRVLSDLAHLANVRADTLWLRLKLLPADQSDAVNVARGQLRDTAERALKAADKAMEVAPNDPLAVRAKIDALRIGSQGGAARQLVGQVTSIGSQPETAYVLAALDLGEESPALTTAIDRLRIAAATEKSPMRAASALVYALARSGEATAAKSELDRMATAHHPPPLLAELKAFVAQKIAALPAEVDAAKRSGADAGAAARAAVTAAAASDDNGRGRTAADDSVVGTGDYRSQLKQAAQASSSGQYDRAEQLFQAALASNPGDTEALSGLGDVARARGRVDQARSYYEQALGSNPHYLPAESALADLRWDSGDKTGAGKLYRDVLENSSVGPYAEKAKRRLLELDPNHGATAPTSTTITSGPIPPTPKKTTAPPTAAPPTDLAPDIDTSDLPGFKR